MEGAAGHNVLSTPWRGGSQLKYLPAEPTSQTLFPRSTAWGLQSNYVLNAADTFSESGRGKDAMTGSAFHRIVLCAVHCA